MPGVFISHASEDAAVARRMVELLEASGVDCWIAPRDIAPGTSYADAIVDGLAAAPALVLVFSQAADLSPHVRRELDTAVNRDTPLLPVRLEDIEPSPSLRYFIGTFQWLDAVAVPASTWEEAFVSGVQRLVGVATGGDETPERPRPGPSAPPAIMPLDHDAASAFFRDAVADTAPSVDLGRDPAAVAELVDRLGRMPLGLTLAAARIRVVGLDRLRESLATSLDLVTELDAAVRRALEGRTTTERELAESLTVFAGPVGLDAVQAVGASSAIDDLTGLVEAGLLLLLEEPGGLHYALPHPVRLVAQRGLANSERVDQVHEAAAAYLLERTRQWHTELDTASGPDVLAAFATAAADVEAAVDAAVVEGRLDTAVDLVLAADQLWIAAGRVAEARRLCGRLLLRLSDDHPRAALVRAVHGRFAYHLSDWTAAEAELRTALRLGEQAGDPVAVATARCYLSGTLLVNGQVEEGSALAVQVHAESERLGLYPQEAEGWFMLALSRMLAGDLDGERSAHERRLDVVRRHGDVARTSDALNTLAEIALDDEDPVKARRYARESLALAGERLPLERRDATITLARALAAADDRVDAGRALGDALAASGALGQSLATAQCLRVAGVLAEAGGEPALAVRLFAAAQALSPSVTGTDDPPETDFSVALGRAREALDERELDREWTLGGALPLATMLTQLDEATHLSVS